MRANALPGSFWPSDRQKLLLRAALLGGEESIQAWQKLRPTFDLDGLEPSSYALLPLVHRQLVRAEFEDPLLPRLRGMYRRAWYLNRLLLGRLMEPLEEMQATGGEPIVVSSWELPARYYGDFGLRRVDALRVLVRPERVDDAARALVDSGWDSRLQGSNAPLRSRRPTRFRKGGDECFLYLRLFHEFCEPKRGLEPRDPWAAAVELSLGGVGVRALSPADELLYLCLNGARTSPWPNVVWIADAMTVFDAAGPEIDWERLVLQATQLRATLRLRDALLFIREELDARVPDDVLRDLDGVRIRRRELLAHRAEGRRWGLLGGPPESLTRFLRVTADQHVGAALAGLPAFLRDEWGLERRSQVPLTAARKGVMRLANVARGARRRPERATAAKS